jgi:hypothetical protein
MTLFDPQSSEIKSAESVEQLRGFATGAIKDTRNGRPLDQRCERLVVRAYADAVEQSIRGLDVARAMAVRDFLVKEVGIPASQIDVQLMGAGSESQSRLVTTLWENGKGRWRCNPAIERPMTTCGRDTSSCYWELTDGTICNFSGVADPNPAKYSVDVTGNQLK